MSLMKRAIQLANVCGRVDEECVRSDPHDVALISRRVRRKLANDFFKNVFKRNNALYVTVLVDHHSDAFTSPLELHQLRAERRAFGDEVGLF